MITDDFLEGIPDELNKGAVYIIEDYYSFTSPFTDADFITNYDVVFEYHSLFEAFLNKHHFESEKLGELSKGDKKRNVQSLRTYFYKMKAAFDLRVSQDLISDSDHRFNSYFDNSFSYEFTEGDLSKIQTLINELREMIRDSEIFKAEHQQRLLRRLERLQGELHKKVSDLDRFWGLIGDAGVIAGKFGKDVKPIVDRIREITGIVWRTQSNSEELPSGTKIPFLKSGEDNGSED